MFAQSKSFLDRALTKSHPQCGRPKHSDVHGRSASRPCCRWVRLFARALVMRKATGFLIPVTTTLNCIGVGGADHALDNTGGSDGAKERSFRPDLFLYANDGSDPVTVSDCGKLCFAVDDQTVAKTDGAGMRSPAGCSTLKPSIWSLKVSRPSIPMPTCRLLPTKTKSP